jgi:hypothetical protein
MAFLRDCEYYFSGILGMRGRLLIRWSLVRVRPGEPLSALYVSKTLTENGSKLPGNRANS